MHTCTLGHMQIRTQQSIFLLVSAGLTMMISTNLERPVSSHKKADCARFFVLQQLDITSASLFPLWRVILWGKAIKFGPPVKSQCINTKQHISDNYYSHLTYLDVIYLLLLIITYLDWSLWTNLNHYVKNTGMRRLHFKEFLLILF